MVRKFRVRLLNKRNLKRLKRSLPAPRDTSLVIMGVMLAFIGTRIGAFMKQSDKPLGAQANHITISWLPGSVKRWQQPMEVMGKKYDVDPNLLAILMTMESGGNPTARSEADAQGLLQITPPTAKDIAAKFVQKPVSSYDLYNPETNIEFSAAYLAYLRDTFGASEQAPSWNTTVELIAAGYNGGPGAAASLEKGTGLHDMQTVAYSRDALNMWRERHADSSPTFERWKARGGSNLLNKAQ